MLLTGAAAAAAAAADDDDNNDEVGMIIVKGERATCNFVSASGPRSIGFYNNE